MRAQGLRRRKRKGAPVIREIITDEEILSKPCDAATAADAAIADDLVETLLASDEAVCLAANQIGETKRIVAYLNEAGRPQVMYNPARHPEAETLHRCGGMPLARGADGRHALRLGARELRGAGRRRVVERKKKLEGNAAQAVQHMIDHCEGILV